LRKIALDIGDVRIGIATSDPMGIIASGYETYTRTKDFDFDLAYFANLAKEKGCDTFVLGLPINMDGTEGERVVKTRDFGEKLSKLTDIKIVYQDERWTTVTAEKMLIETGMRRDKRKTVIDKVAATIILQSYLNRY
jgi:putative Holliday junction resolvase